MLHKVSFLIGALHPCIDKSYVTAEYRGQFAFAVKVYRHVLCHLGRFKLAIPMLSGSHVNVEPCGVF